MNISVIRKFYVNMRTLKTKTAKLFQFHHSNVITDAHCTDESNPELLVAGDQNRAMVHFVAIAEL